MRKYAKNSKELPLAQDSLARMDYVLASMRNWLSIQKALSNEQPEAFYIVTRQFADMSDWIPYFSFQTSRVAVERLGIHGDPFCDTCHIIYHHLSKKWKLLWLMVKRSNQFYLYTVNKQTRLHGQQEDMKKYFESSKVNPCRKEIVRGYVTETLNTDFTRLGIEFSLLCRMGTDIIAMRRILNLIQGKERMRKRERQIAIIARKLLRASEKMIVHINTKSYPLAVRESDPAFEGDPFAVFQAYQRQAEQAAHVARAALEGVRRAQEHQGLQPKHVP